MQPGRKLQREYANGLRRLKRSAKSRSVYVAWQGFTIVQRREEMKGEEENDRKSEVRKKINESR